MVFLICGLIPLSGAFHVSVEGTVSRGRDTRRKPWGGRGLRGGDNKAHRKVQVGGDTLVGLNWVENEEGWGKDGVGRRVNQF